MDALLRQAGTRQDADAWRLVGLIAFASDGTHHPDAFVVLNLSGESKRLDIRVSGSPSDLFQAYRSSKSEQYAPLGDFAVRDGVIAYDAPAKSVTTFYGGITSLPLTSLPP